MTLAAGMPFLIAPTFFWGLLSAVLLAFTNDADAEPLLTPAMVAEVWNTFHEGSPGTDKLSLPIRISTSISVSGAFSITSKGNGVLEVPGASIRIYDSHEDQLVYDESLLHNDLVDIDQDGYNDIVVWGTAILIDDEKEIGRTPVISMFWFDPKTRKFVHTVKNQYIYVF